MKKIAKEFGKLEILCKKKYSRIITPEYDEDIATDIADGPVVHYYLIDGATEMQTNSSRHVLKCGRKRIANKANWNRVRSKAAREQGQQYVTATGDIVPAKQPAGYMLCSDKCKRKCSSKFSQQDREDVFHSYRSLNTAEQNVFLFNNIQPVRPKFQRINAFQHRVSSFYYSITVNALRLQVCKKAFAELFQITFSKIDHIIGQIKTGASAPKASLRGKHKNRPNRIQEKQVEDIFKHITMFPVEQSHYYRAKSTQRQYLCSTLSTSKMYSLCVKWCRKKHTANPVSKHFYRHIFNTHFNYGFGKPRVDTCTKCDLEDNISHKQKYEAAFQQQRDDKFSAETQENVNFITFDLQKTLPIPKLSVGIAFYLRQLWLYNFGVHLTNRNGNKPYFHLWTENEAGRGCEEIGSCLLNFVETSKISRHLIAW